MDAINSSVYEDQKLLKHLWVRITGPAKTQLHKILYQTFGYKEICNKDDIFDVIKDYPFSEHYQKELLDCLVNALPEGDITYIDIKTIIANNTILNYGPHQKILAAKNSTYTTEYVNPPADL